MLPDFYEGHIQQQVHSTIKTSLPLVFQANSRLKYIDLARTKSEALHNIYSLFKQNINRVILRGTQRGNSSKPLNISIVERILVFKR